MRIMRAFLRIIIMRYAQILKRNMFYASLAILVSAHFSGPEMDELYFSPLNPLYVLLINYTKSPNFTLLQKACAYILAGYIQTQPTLIIWQKIETDMPIVIRTGNIQKFKKAITEKLTYTFLFQFCRLMTPKNILLQPKGRRLAFIEFQHQHTLFNHSCALETVPVSPVVNWSSFVTLNVNLVAFCPVFFFLSTISSLKLQ